MTNADPPSTITHDPEILGGRPCIRGTRLSVASVLHMLRHHDGNVARVLDDYPGLCREDVLACIEYGARLAYEDRIATTCVCFAVDVDAEVAKEAILSALESVEDLCERSEIWSADERLAANAILLSEDREGQTEDAILDEQADLDYAATLLSPHDMDFMDLSAEQRKVVRIAAQADPSARDEE